MKNQITNAMKQHYTKTFEKYGCTSEGVDWGSHEQRALIRHQNIGEVIKSRPCSILDVGCGYGAFLDYLGESGIAFTGIDVVPKMIESAQSRHPQAKFICGDFLTYDFAGQTFDYIICNGVFTQKLDITDSAMEAFTRRVISKMFELSNKGIAFNMMTSFVNYRADNLFYTDPTKTVSWVMENLTRNVELNHAYPLYEYIVSAYQNDVVKNLQSS